jgi:GDPmannose 4,6-dehydratase
LGLTDKLHLGNLDAQRDWGFSGDYVEAMWLMLQSDSPKDYVIATGRTHTVRSFAEIAFSHVNLDWQKHVVIDKKLYRPAEVHLLCGDSGKAKQELEWQPKVSFEQLIAMMVDSDIERVKKEIADSKIAVY